MGTLYHLNRRVTGGSHRVCQVDGFRYHRQTSPVRLARGSKTLFLGIGDLFLEVHLELKRQGIEQISDWGGKRYAYSEGRGIRYFWVEFIYV